MNNSEYSEDSNYPEWWEDGELRPYKEGWNEAINNYLSNEESTIYSVDFSDNLVKKMLKEIAKKDGRWKSFQWVCFDIKRFKAHKALHDHVRNKYSELRSTALKLLKEKEQEKAAAEK